MCSRLMVCASAGGKSAVWVTMENQKCRSTRQTDAEMQLQAEVNSALGSPLRQKILDLDFPTSLLTWRAPLLQLLQGGLEVDH